MTEPKLSEPIISVSGLRGVVGRSLTPEIALRFAVAFAAESPEGPMVISRDSRATGPMLAAAVASGLCAVGRRVLDAGIAATPTTGVLVRRRAAAGGIQISASHNPPEYNGLKLFDASGRVLPDDAGGRVLRRFREGGSPWVAHQQVGRTEPVEDTLSDHLELVLATVDVERIRGRGYGVLLDANHGAGGALARRLLERLGCRLTLLGESPDGQFAHPAEPTAENLQTVCGQVVQAGAAIGFCQDPDADRLAVIDQTGRYVGEEYTLALCLDHVLRRRTGPVAANCATSRMSQDVAQRHGAPFYRSPVGEAHVVDLMMQTDAVFGGEGNGGPIDPRVGYVRDSYVGMALILDAMAERALTVGQLADELPRYAIHKTKTPLQRRAVDAASRALESHFHDAHAERMDGLRLTWPHRWLLVRASNTEPIVRIIAEAETSAEAERLCAEAAEVIGRS